MPLSRRLLLGASLALPMRPARGTTAILFGFLGQDAAPRVPTTFLEPEITDAGLMGARLGQADNAAGGRFGGLDFQLVEAVIEEAPEDADAALDTALADLREAGVRLLIVDLAAPMLARLLQRPGAAGLLLFNAQVTDDALRQSACSPLLLHTAPSRRMLADALVQYLIARRWDRWLLITGPNEADRAYANALKRAASRFGGRFVAEKTWNFPPGNRRADSGHTTLQGAIPLATQGADHQVLLVADEADDFGEYLPGRTFLPRPVAGTHGLVATAWSRVHEQWGATQLHTRFERLARRWMVPRDYAAWIAARAISEAATRIGSTEPAEVAAFLRGPDCRLAVFKGQTVGFRPWDGQLRQPILIAGARMLVSVSPQPGFLHRSSVLDTLGDDQPDSACRNQG